MNCPENRNECFGEIDWGILEPEGGRAENCAAGIEWTYSIDITCDYLMSVACEDITTELTLRGLCPATLIGLKYLMNAEPFGRRRYFSGYTGWKLIYKNEWNLEHSLLPDTFAKYTETTDYPLGRKKWMITNDACTGTKSFFTEPSDASLYMQ